MEKKGRYLIFCLLGWMTGVILLYLIIPALLYQCELKEAVRMEDHTGAVSFLVTGKGIRDGLYLNGNRVPRENYIELTDKYAVFCADPVWLDETDAKIRFKSDIPMLSESMVSEVPIDLQETPLIALSDEFILCCEEENRDWRACFITYLKKIKESSYRCYIAICDEGTAAIDDDMMSALYEFGVQTELIGKYRHSYIGIFENGKSLYEHESGNELLFYKGEDASVISGGLGSGNMAHVIIGGKETAVNGRGLNIVVYDAKNHKVVDSVAIDSYTDFSMSRLDKFGGDE